MSVDKLVDSTQLDADLASVADAIRTKGGTSAQLAFPADFVQAIEDIETGGGGNTYTFTSYTAASNTNFRSMFNAAQLPLAYEDEFLIWNIKGTATQSSGSAMGKCGIVCVQNGVVVGNFSTYKGCANVTAPDSATPATRAWSSMYSDYAITDGKYVSNAGSVVFFIGGGNTIEFVQIPYNIGWNVS